MSAVVGRPVKDSESVGAGTGSDARTTTDWTGWALPRSGDGAKTGDGPGVGARLGTMLLTSSMEVTITWPGSPLGNTNNVLGLKAGEGPGTGAGTGMRSVGKRVACSPTKLASLWGSSASDAGVASGVSSGTGVGSNTITLGSSSESGPCNDVEKHSENAAAWTCYRVSGSTFHFIFRPADNFERQQPCLRLVCSRWSWVWACSRDQPGIPVYDMPKFQYSCKLERWRMTKLCDFLL